MNKDIEEIKIVDLDIERTRPSNKASGLRHMYLRLSTSPNNEWVNIFNNERAFPRHSMWRHAWIEGQYIVVDCVPEEVERYHLNDLKQDVLNTNAKYTTYLQQVQAKKEHELKKAAAEKEELGQLKGKLKFD